jgi:arsenical pump membrane protein
MRRLLLLASAGAVGIAVVAAPDDARSAAARSWAPFVLVAGLLLIGRVAHEEGLLDRAATVTARHGRDGRALFVGLVGLVAVTTVILNLDTSVAFVTPILVLAARRRGLAEEPFLYAALFMANAASLLLPGSNLTNLLVLAQEHTGGWTFATRMFPAWAAAVVVTTVVLLAYFRHDLDRIPAVSNLTPTRAGAVGAVATVLAGLLVVFVRSAALPVLAVGMIATAVRVAQQRIDRHEIASALDLPVLISLFGVAVALGTLANVWSGPSNLVQSANSVETAVIGAVGAVALNNLPAAVLFTSRAPLHPRALLIGLDLGPNLAVTGSLSALLWYRAAQTVGAAPSIRRVSRIGVVLVPCSMLAAIAALGVFAPTRL